jgi:hypothetical protein
MAPLPAATASILPPPPAPAAGSAAIPLFDEQYRWALLSALRWLRRVPEVDLDDPAQLDAAYGFLSAFVQESVRKRGLLAKLDSMRVEAVAESSAARSTVESILAARAPDEPWQETLRRPEVREMVQQGIEALELRKLDVRAIEKRKEFARTFGLHARIARVDLFPSGDARVEVVFDQDVAFEADDLKELVINGVPLTGAQLVEVRRREDDKEPVSAVISVKVDPRSMALLRARPLRVSATTKDDVQLQGLKVV